MNAIKGVFNQNACIKASLAGCVAIGALGIASSVYLASTGDLFGAVGFVPSAAMLAVGVRGYRNLNSRGPA